MRQTNLQDYFSIVYILGWIVMGIGAALMVKAALSKGSEDLGLSLIFGGLYMTAFVKNAWLKVRIIELERQIKDR